MEYIEISLPKEDANLLLKCINIAKSKKKLEAGQCLKRNQLESHGNKYLLIQKLSELSEYMEYLIKKKLISWIIILF